MFNKKCREDNDSQAYRGTAEAPHTRGGGRSIRHKTPPTSRDARPSFKTQRHRVREIIRSMFQRVEIESPQPISHDAQFVILVDAPLGIVPALPSLSQRGMQHVRESDRREQFAVPSDEHTRTFPRPVPALSSVRTP